MPFPEDMVYVRWEFAWNVGSTDIEIQDFGLWGVVLNETIGPFPDWQDVVDAIALKGVTSWVDHWLPAGFTGRVIARRVVAYHYDQPHANVLHRGEAAFSDDNSWAGTGDALPPQTTVAVSTYAFDPSGFATQARRKRGRFYLPTPARAQLDSDGELTSTNQNNILANAVAFCNAMSGALGVGTEVHWRPYVNSVAGSMANEVTHLRVGRIVDTQRRRRNKLAEAYVTDEINT
jgi:hypothetical protein